MSESPIDLLLHPVRLRIVQALVNRPMTTTAVSEVLGDVSQATLYRHISQLKSGGLIEVVDERRVRGGIERTYQVIRQAVQMGPDDLADVDPDSHFRYFATFVATLLADFAAYLQAGPLDVAADRVGYQQVPVWLTDEEFDEMAAELRTAVHSRMSNTAVNGRRRRLITSIAMPDDRPDSPP